jgi:hypothetical protein
MPWPRVPQGAAPWEARSSAVRSEADAERQWEPPRVPSQEPVATDTGVVIIIGVMVVVGFARVEGHTPCPLATAGSERLTSVHAVWVGIRSALG